MEERYAVVLNGGKIGTVHLDPAVRGTVRARLAPLPAFRAVARHRRALAAARCRRPTRGSIRQAAATLTGHLDYRGNLDREAMWQRTGRTQTRWPPFERTSKRRRGFPERNPC